jgi:myosin heavy subunit
MTETMTITRTTEVIAGEIRALALQFKSLALTYAVEIGRRLCEAKELVDHGGWEGWLEENTEFSQRTANYLMQIFTDYGADQMSFDGAVKSQTFANLSYSKAVALLQIPADEREEFIRENDVDAMSTRKLQDVIKERDELRKSNKQQNEQIFDLQKKLDQARKDYTAAEEEAAATEKELKELRELPVDVTGFQTDPEEIETARVQAAEEAKKQAAEEWKKSITAIEAKLKKAEKDAEAAKKKAEDLEKKLANAKDTSTSDEALEKAQERARMAELAAEDAKRRLAIADPSTAKFAAYYNQVQVALGQMLEIAAAAQEDKFAGYKNAVEKLFEVFGMKFKQLLVNPETAPPADKHPQEENEEAGQKVRTCRVCGCTDDNACPGGCSWVEDDLCSACADPEALPESSEGDEDHENDSSDEE